MPDHYARGTLPNRNALYESPRMFSGWPENLQREQLAERQLRRLRLLIETIGERNPFWSRRLSAAGVTAASIQSLADLGSIPLLTKAELVQDQAEFPPYGSNLTFPLSAYVRLHQTSGTTGNPLRCLDTEASWRWFIDCWRQIYRITGVSRDDRIFFPFSFGPFIGFWAGFEGARSLGALTIAGGGMSSEARLQMIQQHQATVICCTPTYALRLADVARQLGISLAETSVRSIIVAGEPGGSVPGVRDRIEADWNARVFDHWGMSELGALGVESREQPGGLLMLESECLVEILHIETQQPVPLGDPGELVVTNLGRGGNPVLRYRTGDLVTAATTPNLCGRELLRLDGGIIGRVDDMISIRGNNVYPSAIESLIREFPEVVEFRIIVDSRKSLPELILEIEPVPALDTPEGQSRLCEHVGRRFKDRLNFRPMVNAVAAGSLPRFELKGRRLVRR